MPIVRVYDSENNTFFLDTNFQIIKDNRVYKKDHLIANGFIDSENLFFIYELSKKIYFDDFWKNFISQIYVAKNNDVELVSVLFDHKIIINNVKQLDKAKKFYNNITEEINIHKYSELKFIFNNQVIAVE